MDFDAYKASRMHQEQVEFQNSIKAQLVAVLAKLDALEAKLDKKKTKDVQE